MLTNVYKRLVRLGCRRYCTQHVTISSILNDAIDGNEVLVEGWALSVRKMKDTVFIDVCDGSTNRLQVTAAKTMIPNLIAGCSLRVRGHIVRVQRQLELHATALTVLGHNLADMPVLPRKTYGNDYLRQHLHMRHRTAKFAAVARLRDRTFRLVHEYMARREFVHVHTPVLTGNDCEGAGETFALQQYQPSLFSQPVYLTVSAQLHLEALAHGLGRVYTLNPVFRAENSRSRLHLSEFYMLEAEQAFVSDLTDLMRLIEDLMRWLSTQILELSSRDVELASDNSQMTNTANWISCGREFPVLEYIEAACILQAKGLAGYSAPGGLNKEQELALVAHCGQIPTFVVNWPRHAKPAFYMKQNKNTGQVMAVDLLAPVVGELVGGSVREDDYETLRNRCAEQNILHLDWYTDLRQFCGAVPSAGFGMGFERYLQLLCDISNIKDTILFPRWPHNCAM